MICKDLMAGARYKLVAIISYGMGCGSEFSAGVYESAFHHREWIDLTLQNECQIDEEGEGAEKTTRSL
jgi:hypothetical protein